MGPNDVGTITLHRMEQVEGFTISATSAAAPSKAKKDYEKGLDQAKKGKFEEAQHKFESAVAAYPNYAVAWVELGRVQNEQHAADAARASFEHAIAADSKFVTPYQELARLALAEKNGRNSTLLQTSCLNSIRSVSRKSGSTTRPQTTTSSAFPIVRRVLGRESTSMRNITCPNLSTC